MTGPLVVVGASVATTAFIERLRELSWTDPVRVIDSDPDAPYDRPPLSKHYLIDGEVEDIAVDWTDLDVELTRGRATGVDAVGATVTVEHPDGTEEVVPFGRLVLATGALPVRLPIEPEETTVLRSAADARSLRARTSAGESVVVIGAGAIGVELASSLAARGSRVSLLDRASGPLERLLAGHLKEETSRWLSEAGIDCHWEADISRISAVEGGWVVELADGAELCGDVLISAVGARPAVEWLRESGLLTGGALVVDDEGRVIADGTALPNVFGIGDAISFRGLDGALCRTESWAEARQHGTRLAENISGSEPQAAPLPYFWTEIAGRKLQVVGTLRMGAVTSLEMENPDRRAALYRVGDEGAEPAWIGVNAQPRIAKLLMGV
ncbi:NAD(P)/FAD-dependent oxidoreductase [Microbacterium sp. WCS2018Hpa-9]|uniref:NAD(P)/FAD-dependent oxidoreductase n=1 Tax=Microbacterium sp. WCS2018Hpa-9 TaxID=3073635 RepID=UPI002889E60D|nr:NAD(P)/FAD-dependent oxidoreductase [Microbacterium sp. WCS2018Hpa-9]